jgi:hypothetical protein
MNNPSNDNPLKPSGLGNEPAADGLPAFDRRLGGLLVRKPCWTLSFRGKLLALGMMCGLLLLTVRFIHPFLAVTDPVPADVLIIEGWVPADTMREAAAEFRLGGYHHLILLRPILDVADKYQSGRYTGDYMANLLIEDGVPPAEETTLFPVVAQKDRTYHSALVARQWLAEHNLDVKSLDLATLGPHARRSRLLYEQAFGGQARIGIIALANREYDPNHWWRSSEGVREVISEAIAYAYAKFIFWPAAPKTESSGTAHEYF